MTTKTGHRALLKGMDYGDLTSDAFDGPRNIEDRKKAKRFAAKRQRRKAKKDIEEHTA